MVTRLVALGWDPGTVARGGSASVRWPVADAPSGPRCAASWRAHTIADPRRVGNGAIVGEAHGPMVGVAERHQVAAALQARDGP
jgi:hypothetical protein